MAYSTESQVLTGAFTALSALLAEGPGWELKPRPGEEANNGPDTFWDVHPDASSFSGTLLVEPFARFTPRAVDRLTFRLSRGKLKQMRDPTVLVVASWLSPRSRALLEVQGWSYLDLTGNVLIKMARPALYLRLAGSGTDPNPRDRSRVLFRGAQVNALVRLLVDVEPPYRMIELAAASGLSNGYVSRTLAALDEQALIERAAYGRVEDVKWVDLVRLRAAEYDLLRSNHSGSFLARSGPASVLKLARNNPDAIVTGSFAAVEVAPVAAPAQVALYVPDITTFANEAALYPAKTGANVVLLQPASRSQVDRPRIVDGIRHAGLSQLVLDLLSGNGRLPEEGEAVLEWMIDTPGWRLPQLPGIEQ